MIEITTTNEAIFITEQTKLISYPKNMIRFDMMGDTIHFTDTPTNRDVLTIKIDEVSVNGEALTGDTIEIATKLSEAIYNAYIPPKEIETIPEE